MFSCIQEAVSFGIWLLCAKHREVSENVDLRFLLSMCLSYINLVAFEILNE